MTSIPSRARRFAQRPAAALLAAALLAALSVLVAAPSVQAAQVLCTIKVDKKVIARKQRCDYVMPMFGEAGKLEYGGYAFSIAHDAGDAFDLAWNGKPNGGWPLTPLGLSKLKAGKGDFACYVNDRARLCVKLVNKGGASGASGAGAAPPAASGAWLIPDLPGAASACVRLNGPARSGTTLVIASCRPQDRIFVLGQGGELRIVGRDDLCIGIGASQRYKDTRQVMLGTCPRGHDRWTTRASSAVSGTISAPREGGLCFVAVETGEGKRPFPHEITIGPCGGFFKPTRFFLTRD